MGYYIGTKTELATGTISHAEKQFYQRSYRYSLDGSILVVHCNSATGQCATFDADAGLSYVADKEAVKALMIPDSDWNEVVA
jgi:hypothetical protein